MDTKVSNVGTYEPVMQVWDAETDSELLCIDVHAETHDTKSFTFASPAGKSFDFLAGQYFAFDAPVEGGPETRCYSISSSPFRRHAITVTVKRVASGRVSNWLHDNLRSGMTVRVSGPLGQFMRPPGDRDKYMFLSGGSGITPLMGMTRELADLAKPVDVVFLHAGRTPGDLLFRADLAAVASRLKGFRTFMLPEALTGEPSWPGFAGRISRELLALAIPDLKDRIVLCCGPAPFMAAARQITAELGVPAQNYIEESFDAAVIEEAPVPLTQPAAEASFKVTFAKQNRSIDVVSGQTVLGAAKKSGVRLPSSCANGLCGTCKSKLVSGMVDMAHNGGIRQREIDAGLFLPCCSKPLSDLVVDR